MGDGARPRRLHRGAFGAGGKRGIVRTGELNRKRLADPSDHAHVHRPLAHHRALGHGGGRLQGLGAADHPHAAPRRHGAGDPGLHDLARPCVLRRRVGEEAVELIVMANLHQVALAHGLPQPDARDRHAVPPVLRAARGTGAHGLGAQNLAHHLAAVVGALIAHHLVARAPVLVGAREVAVEGALELARAQVALVRRDRTSRQDVVQLVAVGVHHGEHVVGRLHAALELEGVRAGLEQVGEQVDRVVVARAERALAPRCADGSALLVQQLVGQAARLRAHAAVGRTACAAEAREQAHAGVAEADRPVREDLQVEVGACAGDLADLGHRELARERHALGALRTAPGGAPRVVDVRLRGDMGLHLGHEPPHEGVEPPVLDDERVRPQLGAVAHELQGGGHLGLLDDDVHRHVHARARQMGRPARVAELVVREVAGLAAGVEIATTEVDRIRAAGERRGERLRAPGGRQQLRRAYPLPR